MKTGIYIRFSSTKRLIATTALLSVALACTNEQDVILEWPYVGSEQTQTKYSAADDITTANVDELEIVWKWEPNEMPLEEYGTRPGPFQATPVMIGNVLYLSTMYTRVAALDAETGAELWTFDPGAYEGGPKGARPSGFLHRGVAWWSDGDAARIFLNSRDRLYAIDAATGEPVTDFGESGSILLTEGHGRPVTRCGFDQTSPPVVFEGLVIVGNRVPDRLQRRFDTPGTVQAFDARTGERRWVFFTIPQSGDDFGANTWKDESWRYTGHANVWGLMSVDTGRGLLYAHLAAIDLNAGEIAWKAPFGEGSDEIRTHPLLRGVELPERLGTQGNSGPLVTGGGLVFLGGGAPYLYAFDKATGAEVWRGAAAFSTYGNPMTYRTRSGRQFIVIATGKGSNAALVAFALPE